MYVTDFVTSIRGSHGNGAACSFGWIGLVFMLVLG